MLWLGPQLFHKYVFETLSNVVSLVNLGWALCTEVTFVPCLNTLMLFGIQVSLPIRSISLRGLKKKDFENCSCYQLLWVCVMLISLEGAT